MILFVGYASANHCDIILERPPDGFCTPRENMLIFNLDFFRYTQLITLIFLKIDTFKP